MASRFVRLGRKWQLAVLAVGVIGLGVGISVARARASSPPLFLITPKALDFGYVPLGSTAPQQVVTIKNVSGEPQVMSGSGGGAGVFGGAQNCEGQTLAPGKTCRMFYAFTPTALGAVHGSTNGSWNGQGFSLTFKGTGIPGLLITPTSLVFGDVKVGTTSHEQTITVRNMSNKPAVMSGSGGGAGVFGGAQNCQGQTIQPGKSCQMFYAFSPTAVGAVHGTTNGSWNGQPFSLTFSGTGK